MFDQVRFTEGERHIDVPVRRRTGILLIAIGVVMIAVGLATASAVVAGLGAFLALANVALIFAPSWFKGG